MLPLDRTALRPSECHVSEPSASPVANEKKPRKLITDRWNVTVEDLTELVDANPSLRGMIVGYLAEQKLRQIWVGDDRVQKLIKYDDHDRTKKGDVFFEYKGVQVRVEVKSLQTNHVEKTPTGWKGKFQCDASDRRPVTLPNGEVVETTCLLVGEFDLLAVNLFEFGQEWRFAFAKNEDLPHPTRKYTPEQRQYLLKGMMDITWPLQPPYRDEPFALLDEILRKKRGRS